MINGNELQKALDGARPSLEAGLAEAEKELRALDERRSELLSLIGQARAALGLARQATEDRRQTLHDAIAQVLHERGNEWMTVRDLASEINGRGLYRKKDGSPVEANQVHARAKNYSNVFEKDGPRVRLLA